MKDGRQKDEKGEVTCPKVFYTFNLDQVQAGYCYHCQLDNIFFQIISSFINIKLR
jgi:hypothetical protein